MINPVKQRVLFITYFSANEPLLDSRTTPVLREMSKKGIEFHLITFEKNNSRRMLFTGKKELKKRFEEIGVKWHPLCYHKKPLVVATFYDIFIGIAYSLFIMLSKRINYIHAQTSVGGIISFFISRICRKKYIYDINGLLAEEYADAGIWNRRSIVFKIVSYSEKRIIFHADGIIPLSYRFAENIKEGQYIPYKKSWWNYQVIPSHVDMERFNVETSRDTSLKEKYNLGDKFVLIYIGSVGTWYMLGEMLDFFKVMKNIIPEAVFLIVSHTDKDIIKKEIYIKNMEEKDIIVTEAFPADIPAYLSLADAAIAFIKPVFSKEACSPIKTGEYLASGLPVVINANVGDTEELVKKTGCGKVIYKFEDREYERTVLELGNLITRDKALKEKCIKAAQENFSLEMALTKYRCLYKNTFGVS